MTRRTTTSSRSPGSSAVDAIVSGDRDLLEAGLSTPPAWAPGKLIDHLREH